LPDGRRGGKPEKKQEEAVIFSPAAKGEKKKGGAPSLSSFSRGREGEETGIRGNGHHYTSSGGKEKKEKRGSALSLSKGRKGHQKKRERLFPFYLERKKKKGGGKGLSSLIAREKEGLGEKGEEPCFSARSEERRGEGIGFVIHGRGKGKKKALEEESSTLSVGKGGRRLTLFFFNGRKEGGTKRGGKRGKHLSFIHFLEEGKRKGGIRRGLISSFHFLKEGKEGVVGGGGGGKKFPKKEGKSLLLLQ